MRWNVRVCPSTTKPFLGGRGTHADVPSHSIPATKGGEDIILGAFFTVLWGADIMCWGAGRGRKQTGCCWRARGSLTEQAWNAAIKDWDGWVTLWIAVPCQYHRSTRSRCWPITMLHDLISGPFGSVIWLASGVLYHCFDWLYSMATTAVPVTRERRA